MDRWRTDIELIRPANRRGAENFDWNVGKGQKKIIEPLGMEGWLITTIRLSFYSLRK